MQLLSGYFRDEQSGTNKLLHPTTVDNWLKYGEQISINETSVSPLPRFRENHKRRVRKNIRTGERVGRTVKYWRWTGHGVCIPEFTRLVINLHKCGLYNILSWSRWWSQVPPSFLIYICMQLLVNTYTHTQACAHREGEIRW